MSALSSHREQRIGEAILALQELAEVFQRRREVLAREAGLTVEQWRVLEEIEGDGFMPSLFARERQRSRAAVSKIIRQLLDKGIVKASVSQRDGRQRTYRLTAKGRAAMERLRRGRQRAIDEVWSRFDARQLEFFTRFSRELWQGLDALTEAPPPPRIRPTTERKRTNG